MWKYYLLLFISSGCIMTLELLAGRLVAPYIGVSLYTWTGIIGACLTGMSLGSLWGGWMADRFDARRLLSGMLFAGALLVAGFLLFQPAVGGIVEGVRRLNLSPLVGIFLLSTILFGIPCFFIAAVSPVVYKLALREASGIGSTVGRLSASGIAGSILGTYATGFWLVPTFGTQSIVTGIAVVLGLLGVASLRLSRRFTAAASLLVLLLPAAAFRAYPALARNICQVESAYYCIRVSKSLDNMQDNGVRQLILDSLIHAGVIPGKPDVLWYEYEQVAAWIIRAALPPDASTLFLGGGGYVLPHWVERHYPQATVDVVEIDPAVTKVALEQFVPESRRIRSYHMDARQALIQFPPGQQYDLVFGDVFNDLSVPYHLTTVEFARLVRDHLTEDGLYVMNVIDKIGGPFVGAIATTLAQAFPHVYTLPGSDRRSGRTPHIIVASVRPLPLGEWDTHPDKPHFVAEPLPMRSDYLVLTDRYVPTDSMLLELFRDRWTR